MTTEKRTHTKPKRTPKQAEGTTLSSDESTSPTPKEQKEVHTPLSKGADAISSTESPSESAIPKEEDKKAAAPSLQKDPQEGTAPSATDNALLEKALQVAEDKYLRLAAEFDNYRKRQQQEQQTFLQTANATLIEALLPVLDDLERAHTTTQDPQTSTQNLAQGLGLILQKFKQKLQEQGVMEIAVSRGDAFNAELHEAVAQAPAPEAELRGKILAVIEKGYRLQKRVLRYTKVQTAAHE